MATPYWLEVPNEIRNYTQFQCMETATVEVINHTIGHTTIKDNGHMEYTFGSCMSTD